MANSTFTVKVNVQDGGDIKKIEQALAGLGATVTRTSQRTKDLGKETQNYHKNSGIIGIANSTKSFSKLAESIGSRSTGLVSAYAELAANAFAVSAAFNLLRNAAQVEQIFRGLEAAGARSGLALNVIASGLKEVAGNAVSTEQALRSTAQIASAGFGKKAILDLTQVARDA